ncbi:DUF58 domain-containing protein [Aciduricibacillus chroicocephali]|uniref:DUF58 domain-containing protein n=1 Tax=Aciduricibacillus chroicocephali TaxID=3054939 RepID=A0ABY9KWT5_9BACI|nr:DUF58 domain-containing protein [Bacillaceae bacterium 44XB]
MKHKIRLVAGVLFLIAAGIALFSFAMFQGDRVSWFLFFGYMPIFLYELCMLMFSFRNWKVERMLSQSVVQAGEKVHVRLIMTRKWPWPLFLSVVEDLLPESLHHNSISGEYIPQRMKRLLFPGFSRKLVISYEIESIPRGTHELNGVRLMASDLFGLIKKEYTLYVKDVIVCYPKARHLAGYENGLLSSEGVQVGVLPVQTGNIAAGARNYVAGDRLSTIDWKKTARLQEMMTKEFEQETGREIMLVLDACPYDNMEPSAFEISIEIVLGLIRKNAGKMDGSFLTIGKSTEMFNLARGDSETEILQHLAQMKQDARRPFYSQLEEAVLFSKGRRDVTIVTPNLNSSLEKTISQIQFQHGNVILVLVQPRKEMLSVQNKLAESRVRIFIYDNEHMHGGDRG